MNRIEIIQALINKEGYKSYAEVGVQAGHCFNAINCLIKVGVDPDTGSAATHYLTSDDFFALLDAENTGPTFDICFSDGLHHYENSERDILNMLKYLKPGGTIVCHDMLPNSKHCQEIPLTDQNEWCGDVWRSWVKLRATRPDLEMYCINTDWGTSIIRKGSQEVIKLNKPVEELTYEDFVENKQYYMNIISVDQFKQKYLD